LNVPENVTVQRVDLAASLALLSHEIANRSRGESFKQGE
jgi:NADH/NAD ratio-sensing transcriptional regulator Rex